ncbi:MAG: hypothetical protein AAB074_13610 [Planctomycetota bacterium]
MNLHATATYPSLHAPRHPPKTVDDYFALGDDRLTELIYWIGDPDARTIRVLENGGKAWVEKGVFRPGDVIRPSGMPGVTVEVSEVFEVE